MFQMPTALRSRVIPPCLVLENALRVLRAWDVEHCSRPPCYLREGVSVCVMDGEQGDHRMWLLIFQPLSVHTHENMEKKIT